MFTGLIAAVGRVDSLAKVGGTTRLRVHAPELAHKLRQGDSVAVSGVCLTALEPGPEGFAAELAAETIARTSLTRLEPGAELNLELPTPAGAPLGGHVVQGHVDATGEVLGLDPVAGGDARTDWLLRVAVPPAVGRFVVEKGSVAIEGISLTVARWFGERDANDDTPTGAGELHVAVIPHTWEATNLHSLRPGDPVNLEADVLMKLAVQNGTGAEVAAAPAAWQAVAARDTRGDEAFQVTLEYLVAHGF